MNPQIDLRMYPQMLGFTWQHALMNEFTKPYFVELSRFVAGERASVYPDPIYPPHDEVFAWSHHCRIQDVKVVIIGQDPYHQPGRAHGLSFSVRHGTTNKHPKSLENIFLELKEDIPGFQIPTHGDLTTWARQGVLLLNSVLTVRNGIAGSHANKGWEEFTNAVIRCINANCSGVVFMLWGEKAKQTGRAVCTANHPVSYSDGSIRSTVPHRILNAGHPSPINSIVPFFGCRHFSRANKYLKKQDKSEIDWRL